MLLSFSEDLLRFLFLELQKSSENNTEKVVLYSFVKISAHLLDSFNTYKYAKCTQKRCLNISRLGSLHTDTFTYSL